MMVQSRFTSLAAALSLLVVGGGLTACAEPAVVTNYDYGAGAPASATPMFMAHAAADGLVQNLAGAPDPGKPLLVSTFVNVNNLEQSSAFGRMTAEQVGARLANRGFHVTEVKLRQNVLVQEQGELVLSRKARDLARTQDAQAVVVGTYAVGADSVFVNVRMIGASSGRVLASYDYAVPMTDDTAALLNNAYQTAVGVAGPGAVVY